MRISSSLLARQPTGHLRFRNAELRTLLAGDVYLCVGTPKAMRIAVVVGKDKLGLPIVSMFEL
jgi:hypothetical protein